MHLANASLNFRRRAGEIADDFAVTYQLTADEKYQVQRELTKIWQLKIWQPTHYTHTKGPM